MILIRDLIGVFFRYRIVFQEIQYYVTEVKGAEGLGGMAWLTIKCRRKIKKDSFENLFLDQ